MLQAAVLVAFVKNVIYVPLPHTPAKAFVATVVEALLVTFEEVAIVNARALFVLLTPAGALVVVVAAFRVSALRPVPVYAT